MEHTAAVSMTLPKIAFFANVYREEGDTYGPSSWGSSVHQVPSDNKETVEAYLREKGIRFNHFIIQRRWTATIETKSGEKIEMMSESLGSR